MKTRFWFILGIIALIVIVALGVAMSSPSSSKPPVNNDPTLPYDPDIITVTVENNVGVKAITVYNVNTGQTYVATIASLPFSFNCTKGTYLQFTVQVQDDYRWNSWVFNPMGIVVSANPAQIRASESNIYGNLIDNGRILMTPNCLFNPQPVQGGE